MPEALSGSLSRLVFGEVRSLLVCGEVRSYLGFVGNCDTPLALSSAYRGWFWDVRSSLGFVGCAIAFWFLWKCDRIWVLWGIAIVFGFCEMCDRIWDLWDVRSYLGFCGIAIAFWVL
jgi:hypothetical protein